MEQDNETRMDNPDRRPEEKDLFDLTNGTEPQPASGEAAATVPVEPEAPAPQILREPEFKVNPEAQAAVHPVNPAETAGIQPGDPEAKTITLRAGAGATLGNLLSEARTTANHSVATVSQETHIRHDFIEALEADQADALPNYVFLRAYVRALIAFYNLDEASAARVEELMEQYQPAQDVPEKLVEDIGRAGQISETETRRIKMVLIYGGIILLLLISLVVTSVIAVSARNKRIQTQKIQQDDPKFDTARLEPLVPPQLPQPQMLQVPAAADKKSGAR